MGILTVRARLGCAAVAAAIGLLLLIGAARPAAAQTPDPPQPDDPVAVLLARLEQVIRQGLPAAYAGLLADSADRTSTAAFAQAWIVPGATRAVVRERDRAPLLGTLPDQGYSLLVETFVEFGERAVLGSWRLDVRQRSAGDWGIVSQQVMTTLQGLYRLSVNPKRQIVVKDLVISSEDLELTIPEGSIFVAEAEGLPTAVIVAARGDMAFRPAPAAERTQLRVFAGTPTLESSFDGAFVRLSPAAFSTRLNAREMTERPAVDPKDLKRAEEIFRQDVGKSFSLDLGDLSPETWSLLPSPKDFLAEIRTRRFDALTYARSSTEIEDISVFDRRKRRNLSVYSSRENLAHYSRFYSEDDKAEFDVQSYNLDVRYDPQVRSLEGLARLAIQVTAPSVNSLTLKLADGLNVQAIASPELGRLLSVRVRNQNSLVVNLPSTVLKGFRFSLEVRYAGRIQPQAIDQESVAVTTSPQYPDQYFEEEDIPLEESHLFSNRSFWYPQAEVLNYAPADIRVTLPQPWSALANGRLTALTLAPGPVDRGAARREFVFSVTQPVRYLSLLVGRLAEVKRETLTLPGATVDLKVTANPRQRSRGREMAKESAAVLQFYSTLIGAFPYEALTLAAIERRLPGGHSPAYLSLLAVQGPGSNVRWSDDPGALPFPEFFLAHEIAHQWWGQAVGWKNYHEQWLSEGFAQYFTALYAEHARGRAMFDAIIRRMQTWAVNESDQGPVFLGYRIGHAKGETRVYRAVVYNKGAMVLHMLRRLVGNDAFFAGLRRFYQTWRFKKAGTDDFRRAMEQETGYDLRHFFELWILGDGVPEVTYSWRTGRLDGTDDVLVRLEQSDDAYPLPVTVTLEYEDNTTSSSVVKLVGKSLETRLPLAKKLRRVDVNRDKAAIAVFKQVDAPNGG